MGKVSSTFKKMHGLRKSCNIDLRGRMGEFRRSPVQKSSLALVLRAPVDQARLFRFNHMDTGEPLKASERGGDLIPPNNSPKPLINIASGAALMEIFIFQFKTSWTPCIAQYNIV